MRNLPPAPSKPEPETEPKTEENIKEVAEVRKDAIKRRLSRTHDPRRARNLEQALVEVDEQVVAEIKQLREARKNGPKISTTGSNEGVEVSEEVLAERQQPRGGSVGVARSGPSETGQVFG